MTTALPERITFEARYRQALTVHVNRAAGEAELMAAFELGRSALAEGYGLLDLLALHHTSLSPLFRQFSSGDDIEPLLARANLFLTQVAAPFEMAYRGWRDTATSLRRANDELEARVSERTAAYREAEERLDRAQQVAAVGSLEWDLETGQQIWSKELYRICGLREEQHLSTLHDVAAFIDHADRKRHDEWFMQLAAGRDPGPVEYRIKRPDGEYRVVRAEGEAIAIVDGTVSKVSFTLQDISERKAADIRLHELQAELAHVSRLSAMGQMAATITHELTQPLTVIRVYMSMAHRLLDQGGDRPAATFRNAIERADEQAIRAAQITDKLRRFASKHNTAPQAEPIWPLVKETVELLLVGTKTEGIRIEVPKELPEINVLADKIQIQQVLLNLLRNAVEAVANQERKEIALLFEAREDTVQISVVDSGPGLVDEVKAKLFQPFVSTKRTGMGIGLSICHTIITAHNGRLWAEPSPTGGTIFRLTLPTDSHSAVSA